MCFFLHCVNSSIEHLMKLISLLLLRDMWCRTFPSFLVRCLWGRSCRFPSFLRSTPADLWADRTTTINSVKSPAALLNLLSMFWSNLVVYGDEGVVWGKSSGGSFTVNQQSPLLPIHHVLFNFGDVVRNVVDNVHVQVVWCGDEHFGEGLKNNV